MNTKPVSLLFLALTMIILGQLGVIKAISGFHVNLLSSCFYLAISICLIAAGIGIFVNQNWGKTLILFSACAGLILCTFLISAGVITLYSDQNLNLLKEFFEDKRNIYTEFLAKFNAFKALVVGLVFGVFFSILLRLFLNRYKDLHQNYVEEK